MSTLSETILEVALMLAYGPLVLMAVLYVVALGARLFGDRDLLRTLITRTGIPEPVRRAAYDDQGLPAD